jgi:hypothetical protein
VVLTERVRFSEKGIEDIGSVAYLVVLFPGMSMPEKEYRCSRTDMHVHFELNESTILLPSHDQVRVQTNTVSSKRQRRKLQ